MENQINVLITDDHDIVRLGTSIIVKETVRVGQLDHAANFEETIAYLQRKRYQLLILDINMPGGNNIRMLEEFLTWQPDLKILVFSSYEESIYALRYIQAGASGYINKNSPKEELKDAILSVLERGKYMSPEVHDLYFNALTIGKSSQLDANPVNLLSDREMDVARLMIEGYGISEVSKKLDLKNSTVSTYKTRIFEKLQIDNIPDLITIFNLYVHGQ